MSEKVQQSEYEAISGGQVELIGGPLCGRFVIWDSGKRSQEIAYYGGISNYEYEGNSKALYMGG